VHNTQTSQLNTSSPETYKYSDISIQKKKFCFSYNLVLNILISVSVLSYVIILLTVQCHFSNNFTSIYSS